MTHPLRRAIAVLTALGTATLTMFAVVPAANAHDQLLSSAPADGEVVTDVPSAISLTFSADIILTGAEVVVTASDGTQVETGTVEASGSEVTAPLPPDLSSGDYDVEWRVVSSDGHPIEGGFAFVLDVPDASPSASDAKASSPAPSEAPSGEQEPESGSSAVAADPPTAEQDTVSPVVLWLFGGVIALLLLALGTIWTIDRRRKAQQNGTTDT